MLDLLVVGGGPVGLAAAIYASRLGLSCAVVERRAGVVDKACGEGVMPGGLRALEELGIDPDGVPLRGISYISGRRQVRAGFRDGPGRGVRRTVLHAAFRAAVDRHAIEVVEGRADPVTQRADAVSVVVRRAGEGERVVSARYLLAADGLHSATRRAIGLSRPARGPQRYGLRRHYEITPWDSHVEVHWGQGAEAYVTPVGETLVGVAVLSERRIPFEEHLAGLPDLRARLDGAPAVTTVRGAGPLRQRTHRRVAGRVLLVGDAAGYVDALTGEGVMLGVAQARAAVAAVHRDDPGSYEREWRAITRRHALLTSTLVSASRVRAVRPLIVPVAAGVPRLFDSAVHTIAST